MTPCVRQTRGRRWFRLQPIHTVHRTLFDIDIYDLDIFVRLIPLIRLHILDPMHRFQPREHAPKYRVFLVEPRGRVRSNEELRSVRVRSCVRHTHSIRPVKRKR